MDMFALSNAEFEQEAVCPPGCHRFTGRLAIKTKLPQTDRSHASSTSLLTVAPSLVPLSISSLPPRESFPSGCGWWGPLAAVLMNGIRCFLSLF